MGRKSAKGSVHHVMWEGYQKPVRDDIDVAGSHFREAEHCELWGVSLNVLKTLDKSPPSKVGLQYPFRIHKLQVKKLLRKPSYFVMGLIDMFVLLRLSLPQIVKCLDFKWMRSAQSLFMFLLGSCC